jgi:hypothetical protein
MASGTGRRSGAVSTRSGLGVMGRPVYAVHAVRAEEICATEVIFTSLQRADEWAVAVSTDPGVLAGAVTRYMLDSPGERHPESLFVKGDRQQVAHLSDDREIAANGYLRHPTLRTPKRRM